MELDVEVCLNNFPRLIGLELAKRFPVEFGKADAEVAQEIVIRATQEPQVVTDIETGIRDFLQRLTAHDEAIKQSCGVLRLGIFYDLRETVVFPFRLSAEMIRTLGELNLSIDATGYPCADEAEDST